MSVAHLDVDTAVRLNLCPRPKQGEAPSGLLAKGELQSQTEAREGKLSENSEGKITSTSNSSKSLVV